MTSNRRLRMTSMLLAAVLMAGTSVPAKALFYMGFCSEPSKPFCVSSSFTFEDEFSFASCRGQVERYVSEMNNFMSCLEDELDDKLDKIRQLRSDAEDIRNTHSEASVAPSVRMRRWVMAATV